MKVAINFADDRFKKAQKLNSRTAKLFGGADKVIEYSPRDIDPVFYSANQSILSQKRGGGYWLWKPYFILKTLESLNEGDYLFYCDSGAFYIGSIDHIIKVMELNGDDIAIFETPLIEREWTNKYLLNELQCDEDKYLNSNQIAGGYILLKKSSKSIEFISEYLRLCCNGAYITDMHTDKGGEVFDHRHDQSILSLLAKNNNLTRYKDPSDYGAFPFKYFAKGRLFRVNEYKNDYPVIVISNRKANPYTYLIKYYIKVALRKYLVG